MDIRERAYAAFFTVVEGAVAGAFTERNPLEGLDVPDTLPAALQFDGGHSEAPSLTGEDHYLGRVSVELYAGGATNSAAVTAVNGLWGELVKAVFANRTLGGEALDVRHTETDDPFTLDAESARRVGTMTAFFEIKFSHPEDDPFA